MDQITREAMDEMMLHEWPGNVRELENAIERAVVVGKGRKILPDDLPFYCPEQIIAPRENTLREIEKVHITHTLNANGWNIARSAEILGIDRSTLYNKIKRYEIHK